MHFIILVSIVIFGLAYVFGSPLVSFFAKKGTSVYEIARKGFLIFPFSRLSRMFYFVYETKGDYYVLGRDYFRLCTDMEMEVYKGVQGGSGERGWRRDHWGEIKIILGIS